MTSDSASSGLQPFSHLKAGPTTSSSRSTAVPASPTTPTPSQSSRRAQQAKSFVRDDQLNGTGDRATVALIRRVLCPQSASYGGATSPYAPEELLPPLTSSNDVDRQLYALIAIIVKEFILSWYSKITPDQALINEVLQLIAHCTRALEQRLRQVDMAQLVLDDIPALVEAHIISYRLAKEQSLSGLSPSSREIYHAINPHPGLSPIPNASDAKSVTEQRENETVYRRLLVDGVLAVLLPTEDLENACLQTLLSDILADLMLGNEVSEKVCEGWFLWESTAKLLEALSNSNEKKDGAEPSRRNRLQELGLLSDPYSEDDHSSSTAQSRATNWIWLVLQYGFFAYVTLRFIVVGLFRNASTPLNITSRPSPYGSVIGEEVPKFGDMRKRPVLDYRLYAMVSQLLDIPQRMPWLGGLLALLQHFILAGPGRVGDSDSVLDRFLHEIIEEYVITPTLLPNLLRASRGALFPHNARTKPGASVSRIETPTPPTPGGVQPSTVSHTQTTTTASGGNATTPAVIVTTTEGSPSLSPDQQRRPSTAEVASIRRRCALGIVSLVPRPIARRVLGIPADTGPRENTIPVGFDFRAQSPDHFQESSAAKEPSLNLKVPPNELGSSNLEKELLASAIETDILDLFADEYCNKHLVYSIIEAVLAKLLPELSGRSIAELMEDRAVFVPPGA